MSYSADQVATLIAQSIHGLQSLAQSVGKAESSADSQRAAALQFFQVALSLEGDQALSAGDAAFAQAEVDKLTAGG